MDITILGLDLAKNVFQVHGINTAGDVIVRRRLRRGQVFEFFASALTHSGRSRRHEICECFQTPEV